MFGESPPRSEPKIAVFDLDGTITAKDTYVDFLLHCLTRRPLRMFRGPELIVCLLLYKAGLRSNHWLKARYLGAIAGGLGGKKFQKLCDEFCQKTLACNIKPKALAELSRLRSEGYVLVLATASFSFYVNGLFDALNMDHLLCSDAMVDDQGRITGSLNGQNCIGAEKARRLQALCDEKQWESITCAYSDDIVDLPLFEMANEAYVVDPGKATDAKAKSLGYVILDWRQ